MATDNNTPEPDDNRSQSFSLSLDWLSVITALIFVLLIRFGIIPSVTW